MSVKDRKQRKVAAVYGLINTGWSTSILPDYGYDTNWVSFIKRSSSKNMSHCMKLYKSIDL